MATASQVLSAVSNLVPLVVAARYGSIADFGLWTTMVAWLYVLPLSIIRTSGSALILTGKELTTSTSNFPSSALVYGGMPATISLGVAVIGSNRLRPFALLLAVSLPFLIAHEAQRYWLISLGKARKAVLGDGLWLAVEAAILACCIGVLQASTFVIVSAWCVGGFTAWAYATPWRHLNLQAGINWISLNLPVTLRLAVEATLTDLTSAALLAGLYIFASPSVAADWRLGQLLFGPVQILGWGVQVGIVRTVARGDKEQPNANRVALAMSTLLSVIILFVALALFVWPRVASAAFGAERAHLDGAVAPITAYFVVSGFSIGSLALLRARHQARILVSGRIVWSAVLLGVALPTMARNGFAAGAWVATTGSMLSAGIWWWRALASARTLNNRS